MAEKPERNIKIDSSFKLEKETGEYKTTNHWAKVRIMKDKKRGDLYIDVLAGRKGEPAHYHVGINPDQTLRFNEVREKLANIRRQVDDVKTGDSLEDKTVAFKQSKGKASLTFKVIVDEPTRTIKVKFGEAKIEESSS
jgi:hypothetical protein